MTWSKTSLAFWKDVCQWCWTPGIWGWSSQDIFLQLIEVRCYGNCCSHSCLPWSCRWSCLTHLWGLAVALQLPTALWTAGTYMMSVCHHHIGISQLQCHQTLVLCWILALWWLWWPHPVWGSSIYIIVPWYDDNAICMLNINIYSMRLNLMNLQVQVLIHSVCAIYC